MVLEPGAVEEMVAADRPVARFEQYQPRDQARLFLLLPEALQKRILADVSTKKIRAFVRHMDPDEATDMLQLMGEKRRKKVLRKLQAAMREKIEYLLRFNPESAAGVMNLDYLTVEHDTTFRRVAEKIRSYEEKTGKFPTVLVRRDDQLLGELRGHTIAVHEEMDETVGDHVRELPAIPYHQDDDTVVETFRSNPHGKIVVLDDDGNIMGVIYSEDILRMIEERKGETLYDFAGVSEEEGVLDGPFAKVRNRYRWLILNLGTAFLAASVVGLFEDTIAAFTLLAVYMPIVAGMGGNAGTQTMAVVVRGIALNQISLRTGGRVILNEVLAGAMNGSINGILVAVIAVLWNKSPVLGLVLGISMVFNLVVAAFFGTLIPLSLKKLDFDPATSATIFITTATDVLGFFVFLGLAKIMIGV